MLLENVPMVSRHSVKEGDTVLYRRTTSGYEVWEQNQVRNVFASGGINMGMPSWSISSESGLTSEELLEHVVNHSRLTGIPVVEEHVVKARKLIENGLS